MARKKGYAVGTGKRRTRGYWSLERQEDPGWWRKSGQKKTRSRHRGGRKSTTRYNQMVGHTKRNGDIVVRVMRAFKQWWR